MKYATARIIAPCAVGLALATVWVLAFGHPAVGQATEAVDHSAVLDNGEPPSVPAPGSVGEPEVVEQDTRPTGATPAEAVEELAEPEVGVVEELTDSEVQPDTEVVDMGAGGVDAPETGDGKGDSDTIELHVKETDLTTVLKLLAEQYRLNVVAGKDVQGKVTADLYGVTLDQALKAILEMNGYGYRREDNFIYIYTKEQLAKLDEAQANIKTEIFVLDYLNIDEAAEVIKPVLSSTAKVAATSRSKAGIPSSPDQVGADDPSGADTLIVTDYEKNIENVRHILTQLDVRPKQVLVEATILRVTLDDESSLGVDFNVLAGVDFHGLSETNLSITNPQSIVDSATTATTAQIPFGRVGTSGFADPGDGLNIGVITNDVSVFVNALETVEDVNVLSNPKVLALNKQLAEVIVGQRLGYRTTTVTQATAVETIEFLDTGTQLRFRPFIASDGFIRMEIHPEVSTGVIDGLGLPSETTTEVTCNVMVHDGHTIVIGGLFDETSQIDKAQVPGLGSVPLVGALFRNDHQSVTRREIVILLTPHIIDHAVAAVEGEQAVDEIRETVLDLRTRFPLYTREKLTQVHVNEAEKFYNRYLETRDPGDRSLALWNAKLARHVAPNNRTAHEMIDELEAQRTASPPRLRSHSVIWRRIHDGGLMDGLPVNDGMPSAEDKGSVIQGGVQ